MRFGILSDIHSNLEALETVLGELRGVDRFLCLGDMVDYGANPNEVVERLKALDPVVVSGNHDLAAIEAYTIAYFNPYAQQSCQWTRKVITPEVRSYLKTLEPVKVFNSAEFPDSFTLVHGSLDDPASEYIVTEKEAAACFEKLTTRVCFIGHSHHAEMFFKAEENWQIFHERFYDGGEIKINDGYRYIINCGSVGQPRDRNPRASFGIFDTEKRTVTIHRVMYSIKDAQKKILHAGLPRTLAERLAYGK